MVPGEGVVRVRLLRFMVVLALSCGAGSLPVAAEVYEINEDGSVVQLDARPPAAAVARQVPARALPARAADRAALFHPIVAKAGRQYEVSPALIDAIARAESGYNPAAVSRAKAVGIMQLMPATARHLGVDPVDPAANIRGGTAYLRSLLNRYDGDIICTIAAYNAGPGAVTKQRCVPRYRETIAYVNRVLDHLANATK
jgi:soluble lytic murein transglycosylase-like protein